MDETTARIVINCFDESANLSEAIKAVDVRLDPTATRELTISKTKKREADALNSQPHRIAFIITFFMDQNRG